MKALRPPSRRWLLRAGAAAGLTWAGHALRTRLSSSGNARAAARQPLPAPPLRKGVNLSHWFQYSRKARPTAEQLAGLRRSGIDHVRLAVDPHVLGWRPEARADDQVFVSLSELDAAVRMIAAERLVVNLDFHPGTESIAYLKNNLGRADALIAKALLFLVRRYRTLGADALCFELMNEPHRFCSGSRWNELQHGLIRTLRPEAGDHWLVASGVWDPVTALRSIEVDPDPRVIYGFHFYRPYVISHQGASWEPTSARLLPFLDRVPYPSDRMDQIGPHIKPGANVRYVESELRRYHDEGWNLERIRREVAESAEWAREKQVPILCTEFGVMRPNIDGGSRLRWLGDVARALTELRIPWTLWDYCSEDFGVARCGSTVTGIEPEVAKALDLKPG
jgi:endoglucanase